MKRIFISYRRDDTDYISGYIYEYLAKIFGKDSIFFDVDTIAGGVDYRKAINDAIGETAMMLVVLGPKWLSAEATSGTRRLDQPNDPVRLEIETALQRNIPIFPLLVQQASVPGERELPPSLAQLSYQNAFAVRAGADFARDMERVSATIERYVPRLPLASASGQVAYSVTAPSLGYPTGPTQPTYPAYPPYSAPVYSAPVPRSTPATRTTSAGPSPLIIGSVIALALVAVVASALFVVLPKIGGGSSSGNQGGPSTTPGGTGTTPAPTQAQQLPPPALNVQPATYNVSCRFDAYGNYYDPAPSNIVTLDNTENSVSLEWSTSITDNDPAGKVWASTSPSRGTVAAGRQAKVTVVPGPTFCHDLQTTHLGTFHVTVNYHITGQSIPASATITVLAN
jgi:hypothetical protein